MNPKPAFPPTICFAATHVLSARLATKPIFHLTGKETDGQYSQWTDITPPGGGPPPHWHDGEDEWWYVLKGRVSFSYDGQ
ncbi:MAG TPA: cupin domain-containing protein [Verrucomicrobiae bacterium]|nr:cupin domain-containing protein [Verrucomicrobiae bacterium]